MVAKAVSGGANVVMLPEMFVCPYNKDQMLAAKEFADPDNHGETFGLLKQLAIDNKIYIIGGTMAEKIEGSERIYNTCLCFDPEGNLKAKHRKQHLFDVNLPGHIVFSESEYV